jgi:uridine phosphorylase
MHFSIWQTLPERQGVELLFSLGSSMGRHPVYLLQHSAGPLVLAHPGLGAPLAVGLTEELIARGARKLMVTGTCGVLDAAIPRGTPVLVTASLRDEGTSFHYQPASRFAEPHPRAVDAIREEFRHRALSLHETKAWTTDAFYRETPDKIRRRRDEGCQVVEMETSALFALGRFRQVSIGALLWASDDVTGTAWNRRHDHEAVISAEHLFDCAMAACLRL